MPFPTSHPALDRALAARGYAEPTPVQLAVLEADADAPEGGRCDMLVSAQTGSGKTVAFGLAMASTLLAGVERFGEAARPAALIIAPTRELALQISRELDWLYAETGARIITCVGGMSVRHEQNQLAGGAHIVIGTPGRLCDHLDKGYLDLAGLQVAVLDEADEMLDLGFRDELETLLNATPAERRTLLFSATISRGIAMLARNYQRDAVRVDTTSRTEPHGDIDYRAMRVGHGDVERSVVNVLRYFEAGGALVFCATREAVRRLHASLRERGFHAVGLSGEMNQRERNDALQALRDGHARVCVATDVAARGLDLPDLGLVIHADLPTNKATLLHRSGRTGRAGRKGVSVLLVTNAKRRRTEQVLQSANIEATWSGPPTADEIRAQDRLRLLNHPALQAAVSEEDEALARQLAERLPAEKIAAAVIGLLRAELPEPEDVSEDLRMRDAPSERPRRERDEREPRQKQDMSARRAERGFSENPADGVWFRLNVGRRRNADPKWLIPMICRLGHITKAEIGPIRIFDEETKFEIVPHAAEAFAAAVADATLNDGTQITPSSPPQRSDQRSDAPPRRESFQKRDRNAQDRPPRERAPREPSRSRDNADRPPREDRHSRHEAADPGAEARAAIEADPVLVALKAADAPAATASPNRRERRDAARAAGKLAPVSTPANETAGGEQRPKRAWTRQETAQPETAKRRWTPDAPAEQGAASASEDRPHRGKPHAAKESFRPRGAGAGKPHRGSPHKSASSTGGPKKPFQGRSENRSGKPAGKFGGKPGGKFSGKPASKSGGRGASGFKPGRGRP